MSAIPGTAHPGFATKDPLTGLVALDRPALKAYLVMTIAPFERQVIRDMAMQWFGTISDEVLEESVFERTHDKL
ncbi:hypothetical protein [Azotobacter chroococcum]|uniref:hypothetical protein n=1 Tax=Azotobacter chroococcum TaxID=353 RepID=UPI0010AEA704|nr:hypothetical protein [Azotobacter chroococcum]TKD45683.1 hypothetical protein FCG41_03680 [Azotobacter chroococcum]